MLIILGGLPASGKSTIAQALAVRIGACYLRVDTVEQAIRSATPPSAVDDVGPAGYMTLYRLAADNLRLGRTVIVDSVNAIEITRQAFRDVAKKKPGAGRSRLKLPVRMPRCTAFGSRREDQP